MVMFLKLDDLTPFDPNINSDKAAAMIEDAEAQAMIIAPCIADLDETADALKWKAVRGILRQALLRWNDAGSGAISTTQQGAGPFQQMTTVDTSKIRIGAFWPSEIERLQNICKSDADKGAFSIDTAPGTGSLHLPWCDLYFGGTSCSCGVDIAGYPIFETG